MRATSAWAVGQLVELRVVEQIDAQTVKLENGGQTLMARTELNLAPGSVLKATVVTAGAQPQLSVQEPPAAPTPQASIAAALGRALPRQTPLHETFPALLSVLGAPDTADTLPREVKAGLEELLARMPDTASLGRPGSLARALVDAGNSLESRLAQSVQDGSGEVPGSDRKWQLLVLRQSISSALESLARGPRAESTPAQTSTAVAGPMPSATSNLPGSEASAYLPEKPLGQAQQQSPSLLQAQTRGDGGESGREVGQSPILPARNDSPSTTPRGALEGLLRDIDNSLARLGTHQLQTATSALQQHAFGFFELPLRPDLGRESALLEFEADRSGTSSTPETPFLVRLELPLGDLGVFRAQISMQGGRVAVSTWSDSPGLRELIAPRLEELDKALEAHGFTLLPTTLRRTQPPAALRHGTLPLVDTRA